MWYEKRDLTMHVAWSLLFRDTGKMGGDQAPLHEVVLNDKKKY